MMTGNAVTAQDKPMPVIRWELIENIDSIGVAGPVTGFHNNIFFVGGGANFPKAMPWMGGMKKYHSNLKVFLPKNDGVLINAGEFELPEATAYGANASTEYGIVYAGGENENGISNKVLLIQWDVTAKKPEIKSLPDLPVAVTNASMVNEGRYIFLAGGETSKSASDLFLCLDMENLPAGWKKMSSVPRPVSHAVFVKLQNDKEVHLYLIGGRKKNENGISDFYSSVYAFDLKSKKWKQKESLSYALSAGT
ncbi:MAG: kelch repeat-containing protein, partial [Flavitalea sp.]